MPSETTRTDVTEPAAIATWGTDAEGARLTGYVPGASELWMIQGGRASHVASVSVTEGETRHSTRISWVGGAAEWPTHWQEAWASRIYSAVGTAIRGRSR